MSCEYCGGDFSQDLEHNVSPRHTANKILFEFKKNRKKFTGNRNGIAVYCSVSTSCTTLSNSKDGKIKISAKPGEVLKFDFKIINETKNDDILVVGVQLAHSRLKFMMNEHNLYFGSSPCLLRPKKCVPSEVYVNFTSPDIGLYEMPVMFIFQKVANKETIIIVRDMVVYVEENKAIHEKVASPYKNISIMADQLVRTERSNRSSDVFRIPTALKSIFAKGIKETKSTTQEENALLIEAQDIFQTAVTEDNYIRFFHYLLWYEEAVVRINLKKYNMSSVPLRKEFKPEGLRYVLHVPGLAEKRPSLLRGDKIIFRPCDQPEGTLSCMFESVITDIENNSVLINGLAPRFQDFYYPEALFDVRFMMSRVPFERMHKAVDMILKSKQKCRIFPEPNTKHCRVTNILSCLNPLVAQNPEQKLAVQHILAGTSGIAPYMVHGPPGTGKTITIVEAILQVITKDSKNRVLVCTDSNMAADHIACQLAKYHDHFTDCDFLKRANSRYRVWETMPASLVQYSNGKSYYSFEPLSNSAISTFSVVVTTLSHAAKFGQEGAQRKHKLQMTHLFIDEAAQASEPSCLIPVVGLLQPKGLLVLAGDPKQLGPVCISHDARRRGLGMSLMERLQQQCPMYEGDNNYGIMLKNNFRSHMDILEIPNVLFYDNQLRPHAPVDKLSLVDILDPERPSRAIMFHGVCSKEERVGKSPSYFNTMELEMAQKYIVALINKHHVLAQDIGIVTPYVRQMFKMKTWLRDQGYGNNIEVGTVEAFQGKEKRVIIITTVRANGMLLDYDARFQLGFLVDDKRFNVALTRAKAKAIVIGNPLCLAKDEKWLLFMNKCREYGTYLGHDSEEGKTEDDLNEMVRRLKLITDEIPKCDDEKMSTTNTKKNKKK